MSSILKTVMDNQSKKPSLVESAKQGKPLAGTPAATPAPALPGLDVLKNAGVTPSTTPTSTPLGDLASGSKTPGDSVKGLPSVDSLTQEKKPGASESPPAPVKTVDELKAEGKNATEIKDELARTKEEVDKAAQNDPKKVNGLESKTEDQTKLEQEQAKINEELKGKKPANGEPTAADGAKKDKDEKKDEIDPATGKPKDTGVASRGATPEATPTPGGTTDAAQAKKNLATEMTSRAQGAKEGGVGLEGTSGSSAPLSPLSAPSAAEDEKKHEETNKPDSKGGAAKQKDSKIIERDNDEKTGTEKEYKGRYAGNIKKEVEQGTGEAGLDKGAKEAGEDWNEAQAETDGKNKFQQDMDKKREEQQMAQAQAEADKQRLSKAEKEKRKENAKGSKSKGTAKRSEGRGQAREGREFSAREYKSKAVVVYKKETDFNKSLAKQYVETKQKPQEVNDGMQLATQKAQDKVAKVNYAALGDPTGWAKEARIDNPMNMVKILQENQPMIDQVKQTFQQGQQLGKQALNLGNSAKKKADKGNGNVMEGIGTIMGGIAQISEGIPQLANLFTIPLGIANIAMGVMGIVQGATQCGEGKEEIDDANSDLNDALGLNRKSEVKGQEGVEAADGIIGATQEVVQRLEQDDQQDPGGQGIQAMAQMMKQAEQIRQGKLPNGQSRAFGSNTTGNGQQQGGPNITNGTQGQQGGIGTGGLFGGGEGDDDYEESFKRIQGIFGGGGLGMGKGFAGGRFGGVGGGAFSGSLRV